MNFATCDRLILDSNSWAEFTSQVNRLPNTTDQGDVFERLVSGGHEVVGVYTPPETRRPDPLAEAARGRGTQLHQVKHFRRKTEDGFAPIERRIAEYRALDVELNVLAFVTAILPA